MPFNFMFYDTMVFTLNIFAGIYLFIFAYSVIFFFNSTIGLHTQNLQSDFGGGIFHVKSLSLPPAENSLGIAMHRGRST